MLTIEEQILYQLDLQRRYLQKSNNKIEILRDKLKNCKHTNTTDYPWEWDSGYGRQKWITGKHCVARGSKSYYNDDRWSQVGRE